MLSLERVCSRSCIPNVEFYSGLVKILLFGIHHKNVLAPPSMAMENIERGEDEKGKKEWENDEEKNKGNEEEENEE